MLTPDIHFQKLRENKYTLSVRVYTAKDHFVHTVAYSSLDEAHANAEADIAEITRLAQVRAAIQSEMEKLPGLHEHSAHLDAQTKQITVALVTHIPEAEEQSDKYAITQVTAGGPEHIAGIHEQHLANVQAHKARLSDKQAKLSFLKGLSK